MLGEFDKALPDRAHSGRNLSNFFPCDCNLIRDEESGTGYFNAAGINRKLPKKKNIGKNGLTHKARYFTSIKLFGLYSNSHKTFLLF